MGNLKNINIALQRLNSRKQHVVYKDLESEADFCGVSLGSLYYHAVVNGKVANYKKNRTRKKSSSSLPTLTEEVQDMPKLQLHHFNFCLCGARIAETFDAFFASNKTADNTLTAVHCPSCGLIVCDAVEAFGATN